MGRFRAFLATAILAACVAPPAADANFVYWSNENGTSIGRMKLNGTGVNDNFITGLDQVRGVAVDSKFIYWAQGNAAASAVGRANLDGTGVNQALVTSAGGVDNPNGIAVNSGSIFWANGADDIGRANLDGTAPNGAFINAPGSHCGVAADESFVYWTDTIASNRIGRAPAGTGTPSDPDFITGISAECGVAVDSSFIYWGTEVPDRSIGRAAIGGTGATNAFIPNAVPSAQTCGVSVNSQYVFWSNKPQQAIGQAKIGGGSPNPAIGIGASNPCLMAAAPSNKITVGSKKTNKKKGTAVLTVKVPGPGQVTLNTSAVATISAASNVKPVGLTRTGPGAFKIPVKPKGNTAKKLKKKGKAGVKVFIHYDPSGVAGVPATQSVKLTLVKKLKKRKKKGK